jgi:small-conductance mechanosensitive channel
MNFSFQELLRVVSDLFTTPILKVGDIVISLSSLFQLVLRILIVVIVIRVLKIFLKQQLLVRLRMMSKIEQKLPQLLAMALGLSPL